MLQKTTCAMTPITRLLPHLLFLILISSTTISATQHKATPKSPPLRLPILRHLNTEPVVPPHKIPKDLKTFYYKQTLDHFNYNPQSYAKFHQRYVVSFKYWGGGSTNSPIFAYLGAEAPLENDLGGIGFLPENAPRFQALQVYIEVQNFVIMHVTQYSSNSSTYELMQVQ